MGTRRNTQAREGTEGDARGPAYEALRCNIESLSCPASPARLVREKVNVEIVALALDVGKGLPYTLLTDLLNQQGNT